MSTSESISRSAKVRAGLGHPIIDSDGHTVEFLPGILDSLKEIAGPKLVDRFITSGGAHAFYDSKKWYGMTPEQRRDWRPLRAPWWAVAAESLAHRHHLGHGAQTILVETAVLSAYGVLWIGKFVIFNKILFVHHPEDLEPALDGRSGLPG